jgi:hypothetical protein
MDSVEVISRIEVKHKARNNNDSRSSVTGNGGSEHWNKDRTKAQMPGLREGKGGQHNREDKHELGNFYAIMSVDSTCHIRSKG